MIKSLMLVAAMVAALVVVPRGTTTVQAAVSCTAAVQTLNPCLGYLTSPMAPLGNCCDGVRKLNNMAQSTPDRQSVCNCLKQVSGSYNTIDLDKASHLPGQCGVNLPYKISPDIDCSTVH
ncbi:non-specific lipid-transfer protein 1-like [Andrographis paniculata]|uniref:non-specific lipid-transfer protein 1-like n=1 Tax=Andrographis paniculata TaxID=175694 RepID=UPI0021E87261|nr:non-specific lipid-transfer protein 1-like [Andrographis paniculata]